MLRYLTREEEAPKGIRTYTPIVLADSKGFLLKREESVSDWMRFEWVGKSGLTTEGGLRLLRAELTRKINEQGKYWVYVWLGTCDLTNKSGKYISLNHNIDFEQIEKKSQRRPGACRDLSGLPGDLSRNPIL